MCVHTNGGTQLSSNMAKYTRLDIPVWFNSDSFANILLLAAVIKLYRVTVDSAEGGVIHAHISPTDVISFVEIPNSIYYYDNIPTNSSACKTKTPVLACYLVMK